MTGKRANHFCENLLQELGDPSLGVKELWSFKVLEIPHARHDAAEAAARADVVILALNGDAELPDSIKTWIEEWGGRVAARLVDQNPVLIALFGASEGSQQAMASTRAYLDEIAETLGVTFLHTLRQSSAQERCAA